MNGLTSIEICAGAGGQALGLEIAGFNHKALVEIDRHACMTLRRNRPHWNVMEQDVKEFSAIEYRGIDLLAGGVPCPPFSVAGNQLGEHDERNLFPEVIRLASECLPKAIMIENVKGLLTEKFKDYRHLITEQIEALGYQVFWKLLNSCDFGVPQFRQRTVLVALKGEYAKRFTWPLPSVDKAPSVGAALFNEMSKFGWEKAEDWCMGADDIAPTLVGGSKKHGGPDLGPTRARKAWEILGVDGRALAEEPPKPGFEGLPRLTVRMAAIIQGFPLEWEFMGKKTPAYRQIGNAFPPPIAKAVGESIASVILSSESKTRGVA